MTAQDNTMAMLHWWFRFGVDRADLAVRRPEGTMIWHRDLSLDVLPLSWARAENAHGAEVYIRPARGYSWPLIFLDDVAIGMARLIAKKYDALVVETSKEGGCHLWLACTNSLDEDHRRRAQRWVAHRIGADPASTSGEHLGRLAGFKNCKRRGTWVNVIAASSRDRKWVAVTPRRSRPLNRPEPIRAVSDSPTVDTSQSAKEWGWACGMLENGVGARQTYCLLVERARVRRGRDAERYAQQTVKRALVHVGRADRFS
jgi:hypothetical protein